MYVSCIFLVFFFSFSLLSHLGLIFFLILFLGFFSCYFFFIWFYLILISLFFPLFFSLLEPHIPLLLVAFHIETLFLTFFFSFLSRLLDSACGGPSITFPFCFLSRPLYINRTQPSLPFLPFRSMGSSRPSLDLYPAPSSHSPKTATPPPPSPQIQYAQPY